MTHGAIVDVVSENGIALGLENGESWSKVPIRANVRASSYVAFLALIFSYDRLTAFG